MFLIIVGALVSLLVFFFEQWWSKTHPAVPGDAEKTAFLAEVNRPRHFWMGPKRKEYAEKLFDKFKAKVEANPPTTGHGLSAMSEEAAGVLAASYAQGLTLDKQDA